MRIYLLKNKEKSRFVFSLSGDDWHMRELGTVFLVDGSFFRLGIVYC